MVVRRHRWRGLASFPLEQLDLLTDGPADGLDAAPGALGTIVPEPQLVESAKEMVFAIDLHIVLGYLQNGQSVEATSIDDVGPVDTFVQSLLQGCQLVKCCVVANLL